MRAEVIKQAILDMFNEKNGWGIDWANRAMISLHLNIYSVIDVQAEVNNLIAEGKLHYRARQTQGLGAEDIQMGLVATA